MALEIPHPRVSDDKQTQNLDRLKVWANDIQGTVNNLGDFNVRDFGANGEGGDDTAAIQKAMDAANDAGGGTVTFPPGVYGVTAAAIIGDSVHVRGLGMESKVRCLGNNFAFAFDPGNYASISRLFIDAASPQSSGGGIDWRVAGFRISVDHIMFSSNLHTSMEMRCSQQSGIWQITDIQWDGGSDRQYGFRIGDGTNLVTDISIKGVIGSGYGQTETWFDVQNNVDTLKCVDVTFYGGAAGMILGRVASGAVTGMQLTNVLMDFMEGVGIYLVKTRGATIVGCDVQTCQAGIWLAGSCQGTVITGGVIQGNAQSGIVIFTGAVHTSINTVQIADNNSLFDPDTDTFVDGGGNVGIDIGAGAEYFRVSNCTIGNYLLGRGYQKYGIRIADGASNHYQISSNQFLGNDIGAVYDGGTGTDKWILGNLG